MWRGGASVPVHQTTGAFSVATDPASSALRGAETSPPSACQVHNSERFLGCPVWTKLQPQRGQRASFLLGSQLRTWSPGPTAREMLPPAGKPGNCTRGPSQFRFAVQFKSAGTWGAWTGLPDPSCGDGACSLNLLPLRKAVVRWGGEELTALHKDRLVSKIAAAGSKAASSETPAPVNFGLRIQR